MPDWTQIGITTDGGIVYLRPLATPGEIEDCPACGDHTTICTRDPFDLIHMQGFHALHTLPAARPGQGSADPPTATESEEIKDNG